MSIKVAAGYADLYYTEKAANDRLRRRIEQLEAAIKRVREPSREVIQAGVEAHKAARKGADNAEHPMYMAMKAMAAKALEGIE